MTVVIRAPRDDEERTKIYRFLYEIWAEEFGREMPGMDHEQRVMRDELDHWAQHFMAIDESGEVIGCLRNNYFARGDPTPDLQRKMQFQQLFDMFDTRNITFTSHLALEPAARGKTVISQLISAAFRDSALQGNELGTCYAALNLVPLYYQLGFRPYAPNFRLSAGVRVPLIICSTDMSYLTGVESPMTRLISKEQDDRGRHARQLDQVFDGFHDPGFDRHSTKALWARLAHLNEEPESSDSTNLFHGIAADELTELMSHLTRLQVAADEVIYKREESGSCMGVLLSGSLGIGVGDPSNPHFVSIIKPGEPFGELGTVGLERHSADVIALEPSEILLFPGDFVERVSAHSSIGQRLTNNLLRILGQRIHANHHLISRLTGKSRHEVRIRRQSMFQSTTWDDAKNRVESYHFDTLADQEGEYERLVLQATIAESIEFSRLAKIGLQDGQTVVDLGSGPGITSTLLAKYFPNSQIVGVEPDATLRGRAREFVHREGIGQCQFVEGTAENIPLDDQTADFCYARLLFQHLPDPAAALAEMKRITKTGGIISILDVDDGTIVTHPEIEGWPAIQKKVAQVQAEYGGDRYIGRQLFGEMARTGIDGVHIDPIPITTREIDGRLFYRIVFGFKQLILKRAGAWNQEVQTVFEQAQSVLADPHTFAMVVIMLAHGRIAE